MIAAWMLYCVALGVLVAAAALLAERAVATLGWATRRVWALAMAGAVILPSAGIVLRGADLPEEILFEETAAAVSPTLAAVVRGVDRLSVLDGLLADGWLAGSTLVLLGLALATGATALRRRGWRLREVDGIPVLVSEGVGPAVVGFVRGRVVLPRWALDEEEGARRMMLRHELEHLRAGDPHLALFGAVLLVTMPWNLPLWYMRRRLALAVEVDCDARVIRGGDLDVRTYGMLLLAVGRRRSRAAYPTAAFSTARSALEHRIDRMTRPRAPGHRRHAALMMAGAALVVLAAWILPQPVRAADAAKLLTCPDAIHALHDGAH